MFLSAQKGLSLYIRYLAQIIYGRRNTGEGKTTVEIPLSYITAAVNSQKLGKDTVQKAHKQQIPKLSDKIFIRLVGSFSSLLIPWSPLVIPVVILHMDTPAVFQGCGELRDFSPNKVS